MQTPYVSRHEMRINLVQQSLQKHSKLNDKAAHDLAVHVLQALDHVPEQVR